MDSSDIDGWLLDGFNEDEAKKQLNSLDDCMKIAIRYNWKRTIENFAGYFLNFSAENFLVRMNVNSNLKLVPEISSMKMNEIFVFFPVPTVNT